MQSTPTPTIPHRIPGALCAFLLFLMCASSWVRSQSLLDPSLEVETTATGLSQPTGLALLPTAPEAPREMLVCEKATGKVQYLRGSVVIETSLDVAVNSRSERGLLGIALHPNFASNGHVYLYYTASSTGQDTNDQGSALENRIVRATWADSVLTSPTTILQLPVTPGPNHDGGVILFGPDGKLYGVIGDLNRNGQLQNFPAGPEPDDTGIVFRLNDDGSEPADNPFAGLGGAMGKVYAYGVRNSFGLDFDPVSQVLWTTENGPSAFDEINRVEPGFNSGWEQIMGPDSEDPQGTGDLWVAMGSHYADPQFSWRGTIGVTSIHFIRSDLLGAALSQRILVGDNNTGSLFLFEPSGDRSSLIMPTPETADKVADSTAERNAFLFGTGFGVVTDIETGPDGVYVASLSTGSIYRLHRTATGVGPGPTWSDFKSLYRGREREH